MNTLVIYDTTGYIISQSSGDVRTPVGIPFLWVEVPLGSYITGVDVSGEVPTAIIVQHPKSEMELLQGKVTNINIALAEMIGR